MAVKMFHPILGEDYATDDRMVSYMRREGWSCAAHAVSAGQPAQPAPVVPPIPAKRKPGRPKRVQ